jgi:hypothetical protein
VRRWAIRSSSFCVYSEEMTAIRCGPGEAELWFHTRDALQAPCRMRLMVGRRSMRLLVGVAPVVILLMWPVAARADLLLVFTRGHAAVGQRVEVVSGDQRGPEPLPPVHGIHLYFVPMAHAKSPRHQTSTGPPTDPTWLPLGRLRHSRAGVFKLSFVIPNVAPGSYTIGFWCIPCAPPKGATFTGAYPGHVATGRPFTKILRVTRSRRPGDRVATRSGHFRDGSSDRSVVSMVVVAGVAITLATVAGLRVYTRRRW